MSICNASGPTLHRRRPAEGRGTESELASPAAFVVVAIALQPHGARRTPMKTAVVCGLALVCASVASAQTPAMPAPADSARTITLTGCVGGGQNAQPITLGNAMVIPTGQNAAAEPSPVPDPASSGATQPTGAAGGVGTAGAASSGVGTPPPAGATSAGVGTAGAAGTTGTAGTASAAGATGTAGVASSPSATPTAGASAGIAGTAPAGSSASSLSGYR